MRAYWNERPRQRGGPLRAVTEAIVCLLVTVIVVQSWLVERFVVPSGSMAETLRGVHRQVSCPDCGWHFAAGSDLAELPLPQRAVCPNCGNPRAELAELPDVNGDRLLVLKTAYAARQPRRWEVAVFRCPDVAHMVYVKRVVGLPGESVQIAGGEVLVDGRLQRKGLADCQALAVPVYDDRHRPSQTPSLPPRFAGDGAATRWQADGTRYVLAPASEQPTFEPGAIDWLSYRHWRRVRGFPDRAEEAPINDDNGYNQSESRLLNYVADVGLHAMVRTHGPGELWLSASDGRDTLRVRIVPAQGACELWRGEQRLGGRDLGRPLTQDWARLEMLLFDRQLHVTLDGEELLPPYPYEPSSQPLAPTSRPLAVGGRGLHVELDELTVVRDVFYTQPGPPVRRWGIAEPYRLAADEYFVLGDNSPLSEDSRYWPSGPAVTTELLVGKPFMVHMPSQAMEWGRLRFQFPRLGEVRYIR